MIHTDDLTNHAGAIMNATFDFLGLSRVPVGRGTRVCVHGKAGVMDVLNAFEGGIHIGRSGRDDAKLQVADCDVEAEGMHRHAATGALHHDIEPDLLARMREYFEPANQDLYRLLGRSFDW